MHVRGRMKVGAGVVGPLLALAIGSAAPQAGAQELAPGVSCDGFSCRNDTDDTYRVSAVVSCTGAQSTTIEASLPAHHSTVVPVQCPSYLEPGTLEQQPPQMQPDGTWKQAPPTMGPGRWVTTYPIGIHYTDAVVENQPQ